MTGALIRLGDYVRPRAVRNVPRELREMVRAVSAAVRERGRS